jgi:hypothetical protein
MSGSGTQRYLRGEPIPNSSGTGCGRRLSFSHARSPKMPETASRSGLATDGSTALRPIGRPMPCGTPVGSRLRRETCSILRSTTSQRRLEFEICCACIADTGRRARADLSGDAAGIGLSAEAAGGVVVRRAKAGLQQSATGRYREVEARWDGFHRALCVGDAACGLYKGDPPLPPLPRG